MHFEFDPAKSEANAGKHGIDFDAAQAIWEDERRIEVLSRHTIAEPRCLVIGRVGDRLWTAIVTYRDDATRLISRRRARRDEEMLYEQA